MLVIVQRFNTLASQGGTWGHGRNLMGEQVPIVGVCNCSMFCCTLLYVHSSIAKYNIGLKTLLQQGISEPIFYGDLVYKFKRIVGKPNFSDQFKKIVKRYKRVGYNLAIMQQSACLVLNPITVYSYGFLFNCTTVGQASDSMTALT